VSSVLYKKALSGDMQAIRWYEMTRTDRNPSVPVVENNVETSYVIEAPAPVAEAEWEEIHSPEAVDGISPPATA